MKDLGRALIALMVHEVILNPDGKTWPDSLLESLGHQSQMLASQALPIIHNGYSWDGCECKKKPI